MKANELRIGNYVEFCYSDNRNKTGIVNSIHPRGVNIYATSFGDINGVDYEESMDNISGKTSTNIKPILITEEWLVKFGFKQYKDPESIYYSIEFEGLFSVELKRSFGFPNMVWEFNDMPLGVDYVHQLQNLYFALTGEELTIKEN